MTEKRSKNVIAWKSSSSRGQQPTEPEQKQTEIGALVEEEAILDCWISKLSKEVNSRMEFLSMDASDVVSALYYPRDGTSPVCQDYGVDTESRHEHQQSIIAIHAPLGSFMNAQQTEDGSRGQEQNYRLHLATHTDIEKPVSEIQGNKRRMKFCNRESDSKKRRGSGDYEPGQIQAYDLPTKRDQSSHKVISAGAQSMEQSKSVFSPKIAHSPPPLVSWYDDDEIDYDVLEQNEGVSDFFA